MDCDSEKIWRIVENHRQNIPKRKVLPGVTTTSLTERLFDCYFDCTQGSSDKKFRSAVNLLHNVDSQHAKVSIIVNLYPDDQGYSLVLCSREGTLSEEVLLPYEDNEIFSYLDNQELSPILLEVMKQTHTCVLYEGCVICEVRDHRGKVPGEYEKQLLLLRPTLETVLATVSKINHEMKCTPEEKVFLESQLIFATQPPICLDPSTEVVCVTNRLHYNRRKFHSYSIRRYLRQMSHAYRARMNIRSESNAPERLKLHDFISKRKVPGESQKAACIDFWKRSEFKATQYAAPDEILKTIQQYASSLPGEALSDLLPPTVEKEVMPAPKLPPPGIPTSVDEFLNTNLRNTSSQQPKVTSVAKQQVAHTSTITTHPLTTSLAPSHTQNVPPNHTSNLTSNLPTLNLTPNPTPSLAPSPAPTPALLDLLRPLQVRKGLRPIAPATSAPPTMSAPTIVAPVISAPATCISTPSTLITQQAAEKATPSVTKPPVASQAKFPSPSQAGTTTAVVVVSPIGGSTGGRAVVNVPRESWTTTTTPPLRRPPAAGSYFLSTTSNVQVLPVLQRPPVISPQQVPIPSSLPKLNPLTPPKVLVSTAPSGKAQVMSMPQLHKLSATITKTSQLPLLVPSSNLPVTVTSGEKDASTKDIDFDDLDVTAQLIDPGAVGFTKFIPTAEDGSALLANFQVLIAQHIPGIKDLTDVKDHIDQKYSEGMCRKSEVVPIGLFLKNEN